MGMVVVEGKEEVQRRESRIFGARSLPGVRIYTLSDPGEHRMSSVSHPL